MITKHQFALHLAGQECGSPAPAHLPPAASVTKRQRGKHGNTLAKERGAPAVMANTATPLPRSAAPAAGEEAVDGMHDVQLQDRRKLNAAKRGNEAHRR